ncbi:putative ABC transporter ATP-binding protein YxlF [Austwickia sp. TVS 96-490-7B]|uniref:ABC transporter ATP-binding protein n=1 Tax=Austwickia sp. TVS 96-490-7B TaxID=2830843 RepID=UPI001C55ACCA|nr:ABC transporter ATP-binding protein [Austwickia sp. TVS 96-490-7B]MBW3083955.1 putative ABC transporter ATP-binding protein YxlF [Austwickia sp. TVS 96-490-7B]
MNAVETRGLRKAYRDKVALEGLDLTVESGQVFGFLGSNGAGKTTTIRLLLGLARPTAGTAHILGHDMGRDRAKLTSMVGYLPDVPGFYEWMRAPEFMAFAGHAHGLAERTLRERSTTLLEMVGLNGVTTKIGGYSRGMKQRLGIAQALINAPHLLILDEPTSALDPIGRHQILDLVASLRGRTTVVFSTHILSDVERVADHVAILDHGRCMIQAPLQELTERYRNHARVHLRVTDPHRTGSLIHLRQTLAAEPWVSAIEDTEDGWILQLRAAEPASLRIPQLIAAERLALDRYMTSVATLEDVFLAITGQAEAS